MESVLYIIAFIIIELIIYNFYFKKTEKYYLFVKPNYNDPHFFGIDYYKLKGPFDRFFTSYLLIQNDYYWLGLYFVISITISLLDKQIITKSYYLIGKSISATVGVLYYFIYSNTTNLI